MSEPVEQPDDLVYVDGVPMKPLGWCETVYTQPATTQLACREQVLAWLRQVQAPASLASIADAHPQWEWTEITEALADLCMGGPVVCIDIDGEPHWALEWGVRHKAER